MNIQLLLDALDVQEGAARALADDLRMQIAELQGRLREAETHLEHLTITRKTITALADRRPAWPSSPEVSEHPDYPRILAVFNEATGPLRARDVCEALDHELLPKTSKAPRAKLKRLVKLDVLTPGRHWQLHQAAVARPKPRAQQPCPVFGRVDGSHCGNVNEGHTFGNGIDCHLPHRGETYRCREYKPELS